MKITSNILDVLILLGALQGFISCGLLFRKQQYAHRVLAVIILIISLACLNIFLLDIGVQGTSTFWVIFSLVVPLIYAMPIGPLLYFYCKALAQPDFRLTRKERPHFYSVVLDIMPGIIGAIFLTLITIEAKPDQAWWGSLIDNYNTYVDIPRWCSTTFYVAMAWRFVKRLDAPASPIKSWSKQVVIVFAVFQAIWLAHLIPYVIPASSNLLLKWVNWYPIYIPLAFLVYWLGVNGYRISLEKHSSNRSALLNHEMIDQALATLKSAMQEKKLYLKPTLNLQDVTANTGLTQKVISAVLNQYEHKTFNEFVNGYRVEEVKRKLNEGGHDHLTLTGLALECGFNSQATFQRTFKLVTGQTPGAYQQSLKEILQKDAQI